MLVVSMSDFLGDPAQYVERARHAPVRIEDTDGKPVTLSVRRPGIFAAVANLFKSKPRQLGTLAGKGSVEFIGDWDITPEEMFDNDEEDFLSPAEARQE